MRGIVAHIPARLIISGIAIALLSGSALAGGFAVREQSAEGLGSAFAGIAAGTDGLSAMFWNPATISQHNGHGYISEYNGTLILPYSRAQDGVGAGGNPDSGNIGQKAIVPASYSVYGLTDELTLGLAMSAPFGLGTDADDWTGSPNGTRSKIFTLNVNPMVAYKPADWITLAVGAEGEYFSAKLKSGRPNGFQLFDVRADDIAFGFTAGILLEPTDDLDIGIGFRSSVKHNLEGDGSYLPALYLNGDMSATIRTPETVTLGIKYHANDQWTFMGGVEWANWSRLKSLDISLDDRPVPLTLTTPENWKDSWYFSLGTEYAFNDSWTFRGGLAYEKSPVPDSTRTPRLPDNDRYWLSVGAGYKVNEWLTANIGYSHVFVKDGDVALAPPGAPAPLSATFKQHIDIVSASATIDW
jgi:long-chain fatty acid transport protein